MLLKYLLIDVMVSFYTILFPFLFFVRDARSLSPQGKAS